MKRTFTKLMAALALLTFLAVPMGMWGQTVVTFTPGTDTGATSVTKGDITATMTTMNNASYYQIYAGQSGTFTTTNGVITKIEFTCTASGTSKYGPGNASSTVGSYSYNENVGTWTGSETSVTISSTVQVRMSLLKITYTPAGGGDTPTTYTVTFDAGDGTFVGSNDLPDEENHVTAGTYTLPSAERTGYTFNGWLTTSVTTPLTGSYSVSGNVDFTADYTENGGGTGGDTETATLTQAKLELTGTYSSNTSKTIDGITYVHTDLMKNNTDIQAKAGSGTIKNTTQYPGDITSVAITHTGTARATTIYGSANGTDWTQVATGSGSITADFSGHGYKYFKITRGSNAAYWSKVEITYSTGGGSSQSQSDLAITNSSTALTFDLYNNADPQVITYSTSSTGEITITPASPTTYFSYVHNASDKTITVTPLAVTPSAQTVTISQEADEDYYGGTAPFTVSVANSDPNVPGTENNPYTVAEAIAAIEQSGTIEGAYVAGIVCQVVEYISNYHSITYWISDDGTTTTKLQVYSGKGIGGADFSSINDIQVNDIVTVTGKLKKYNSTYEFDYNNELVSLVRPLTTMDAIYAKAVEVGSTATQVQIDFGGWVVTGIHQSTNSVFVTDGTKGFIIRQENHGFEVGNTLTGGVTCNLSLAGSFNAQVTGITASTEGLTVGTGGTVTPAIISLTDLSGINTGAVVAYENLTYLESTGKLTDGTNLIRPVQHLLAESYTFEDGMAYNITGIIWGYGSDKEIYPRSAEDIVADNTPFINLDQYTFNYDYVAQGGYHTITYGNLDIQSADDFGVVYCDAQGNVLVPQPEEQPEMITTAQVVKRAIVDYYELELSIDLNNTSASRTTYLKVCTTNTPITYYSDLITVSQTGYAPSITVTPTTVEATAAATSGTISAISDIIYSNPYSPEIKYYAYEGTTLVETTYSWLMATITNGSPLVTNGTINYTISANDGAARTAYMKVYAKDHYNNDVYSELITINQAAPVVDYATLPFAFDGGKADVANTNGLTESGLGTDFGSSPKLKFDHEGDYLVLKINEVPGVLTFDIKGTGNSGDWSGTFVVQASADGTNYTDVATYTDLTRNETVEKTIDNLASNVRYIKWYFSAKTSGYNVALGDINLAAYVAPTQYTLTVVNPLGEHVAGILVFNATNLDDALIENGAAGTVQVLEGTSIVVSPVAASGYVISSLYVNNDDVISLMDDSGAYTFTMTGDVTITATAVEYVEPYTIMFSVNGQEFADAEMEVTPGQAIGELPVPTENIPEGFTFVGWMKSPEYPYYSRNTAPTMVNAEWNPEGDAILDAVFCISKTAQGTWAMSNDAPAAGEDVILAAKYDDETYFALFADGDGLTKTEIIVSNGVINGTIPNSWAVEQGSYLKDEVTYEGLALYSGQETNNGKLYLHLNIGGGKIATSLQNGIFEFNSAPTGYTMHGKVNDRYLAFYMNGFHVSSNLDDACMLYVFRYTPGATSNKDYTTLVTNHAEGFIAEGDAETLYGIHYINGFVVAAHNVTIDGKLVINNGGTLDMDDKTLTNGNDTYPAYRLIIEDGAQLKAPNGVEATVKKNIVGYNTYEGEGNGGYYLISSPINNASPYVSYAMIPEQGDYDLYAWDYTANKEWINYKVEPHPFTTIQCASNSGKLTGYLYASEFDTTLSFDGLVRQAGVWEDNNNSFKYYVYKDCEAPANPEDYEFPGWYLIGNGYVCNAYLSTEGANGDGLPCYVMNEAGDGFVAKAAGSALAPWEGCFYHAETTQRVYVVTDAPVSAKSQLNMSLLRNGKQKDNAIVAFGDGQRLEKFSFRQGSSKVYMTEGNKDYAIVRSAAQGEMPVNFKASKNGTYTLSVEPENVEMSYLHLIDNKTGADVDLLATPSYTFEASNDDYESRFRLVFKANADVEESAATETFAYFNGSEWVISNMGDATLQVVDVMGRVLSSETISGNANVNINQAAGIYMLRLVNGENVKVQKVVVR